MKKELDFLPLNEAIKDVPSCLKNGIMSTSWPFYEKVVFHYKKHGAQSAASKYDIGISMVYYIIEKYPKKEK